ncbi:Chemotaxis protein methyltransferase CheR [Myxococcus hansupus]|uniref:histidine kinase n=1 Tax=Pseudomyxococcus hansupus TaxID=1297742 RepID=A0A0H4X2G5_9BACT|nr:response regulator [Myxococcus hansupus]AKQ69851.1 Chemotaxis protein methyltransferase CheR [Myxococcus hansupus]
MVESRLATVLNVNDDDANRYLVNRLLSLAGYNVLEAATGMSALLLAQQHRPDVVILDVKLPDISGYEVCERLRADPNTSAMAVLHTSATFVTSDKKVRGLDGGADAYLTQPFEGAELIATVKSLLRLRHAEQVARNRANELAAMDRRKDEFLAMLGHELRNPLAAIMTSIGILQRRPATDDKEARMRGIIQRQTNHLARLVDDLLDVSRITRDKVELRPGRLDLMPVLRHVLQVTQPLADARGLALDVTLPAGSMWLDADATRLEQVFTNLLDNAVKYTDQGRVTLHVAQEGVDGSARAVVRVKDTGIGIPRDVLPHIFELFAQADTSLERSRGGLGIGLTLVRKLVQLHGGEVTAHSGGPGLGSEFVVKLPLVDAVGLPHAARNAADLRRGRRILLVEDNVDARQAMRDLLELWGHQVAVAPDGLQGVALAVSNPPELALVDIGLPGLDGYRVAETLRHRVGNGIRLVAMTGYGGPEGRDQAMRAGFDRHLVKPVKPDELDRILSEL